MYEHINKHVYLLINKLFGYELFGYKLALNCRDFSLFISDFSGPRNIAQMFFVLTKSYLPVITSDRSERSSYQQSYMGNLDNIQTALNP